MSLIGLLLVPIVIGGGAFYFLRATITWKEFLAQMGASVILIVGAFALARWGAMQSIENWNGRITDKDSGTESCCHCRTVCDATDDEGNCTSSHEECDHAFDNYWNVSVSTGDVLHDGCNGSSSTPGWWAKAYVGEPASVPHRYTNYLKADPESILRHEVEGTDLSGIPSYPEVHSWYKVKKVVTHGGARVPRSWQSDLLELNADLGNKRQVDVTVLLTKRKDPEFAFAVETAWLYGPKNSLNIVMGTDGETITWARVVTISEVEDLKISLRDGLQGRKLNDPEIIPFVQGEVERKFHRTPMAEFEYLSSAASPEGWWLLLLYVLAIAVSGGLTYWMHREDVFGDQGWQRFRESGFRRRRW